MPQGWKTYTYGKATISVPSGWEVKHDTNCPNTNAPGALLLGYPKGGPEHCPSYSVENYVAVIEVPAGSVSGSATQKPMMVNGVPVFVGFGAPATIVWTASSLRVEIMGTGSDANRILHTFRSK